MGPHQLVEEFLDRVPPLGSASAAALATSLAKKDKSKPKRAIKKQLETALAFGLVREDGTDIALRYRGRCVCAGGSGAALAVRGAFATEAVPRSVGQALLRDTPLRRDQAERRLSVLGQAGALELWLEWLELGRLIMRTGDEWVAKVEETIPCMDAFDEVSWDQMERELYLRLLRHAKDDPLSRQGLTKASKELRESKGKDSEAAMLSLLERVLRVIGFEVQRTDGPREGGKRAGAKTTLGFGPEGDDLAAVFARTPLAYAEKVAGWVLAIEAKAGGAPKKSVGQAVTFAGRVRSAWGDQWWVDPVVVSGRDTYSEKSAKDYARDNAVVHLPLAGLVSLAREQWDLFDAGKDLLTAPALLSFVAYARDAGYTEPTPDELAKTVAEIAHRRSAAWLPDEFGR